MTPLDPPAPASPSDPNPLIEHLTGALGRAESPADLLIAATRCAAQVLGAAVHNSSLFFIDAKAPITCGFLLNRHTVGADRLYRPYRLEIELGERIKNASSPFLSTSLALPLLVDVQASLEPDRAHNFLLVPVRDAKGPTGLWIIPLKTSLAIDQAAAAALMKLGEEMAGALRRVYRQTRDRHRMAQLEDLHEHLMPLMVATDRGLLINRLLQVLSRHFAFSRVFLSLVNQESQSLRCEMHSGFETLFIPATIPLSQSENLFVGLLNQGRVALFESELGNVPPELSAFGEDPDAERIVVIPLRIDRKPLGFIYADQRRHDGHPLFPSVIDVMAQLASAALENLDLRRRAEERAETDPLTGLHNRYFMDKVLNLEIPRIRRYNHPLSVLMIDLLDFKRTNDTYGHQFGDYVLRETAQLIQANVRRPDIVIRYGGDEFVVLMVNTTYEQATLVRRRIEEAFIERNRLQSDESRMINISIGLKSADADCVSQLFHQADMAMYEEKARQKRRKLIEALVEGSLERIEAADRVVGSLWNMLQRKAPYYPDHARRVTHLALRIARLISLGAGEREILALAAMLHDVGKVSIPTPILQKDTPLTHGERLAMRHHPQLGEEFFEGIEHLEPIRPLIRTHHERYDGRLDGDYPAYPDGLVGQIIPLGGRIIRLAESIDGIIFGRSYRAGLGEDRARAIIEVEAGRSFDPDLARSLLAQSNWTAGLGDPAAILALLNAPDPAGDCQPLA
ncbi:MAG: Cyclic di-GMP phosphodiesterase response regulator RpfG [candidate division BRC1 bacterium ADurb.BinA292]|nr:MAG: Cyclic di-GMP phosphodiesterase response regulator RpfG [candidate division BRC1 bacterium ADurb.BinA292]